MMKFEKYMTDNTYFWVKYEGDIEWLPHMCPGALDAEEREDALAELKVLKDAGVKIKRGKPFPSLRDLVWGENARCSR